MKLKRFLLRLALSLIVLAGLSTSFSARAETLAELRAGGTLRVGVGIMGLKPYIWQNPDGSYTGLEHDILQYVLKEIGVPKYEYVLTEWQTLIPGLKSDRWDIIMSGLGFNQERLGVGGIAFAHPHLLYVDYVIVRKDSPIQKLEDLKGKTVASVLGSMDSLNAHNLKDAGKIGEVQDFNGWGEPFIALRNQQVDAVIIDQMTYLGQVAELQDLRLVGEPMPYQPKPEWAEAESKADYKLGAAGIILRSDDVELKEAIDKAIDKMFADGTHEALLKKYGAWDPSQANPMK
ncbi:MAG TPA: transporter substrate-binding domain-containing protein [Hypericibacter adhaerens]|jgi:ABC-type amino acid transport substrate-binding protein|uniref:Amino acid ABC transporter substrate-binding protein n=1 Tax=Hypericibacter adhaerens TaxID=2602016 RepID=A0A5J6MQX9_9PROT|nr:transporter substrate-binding domain-containing protein [Hypericibacter adhaerens]QEX20092.1 amino acid ABC transporter substrate-binding protein [Hypericibacter adhaerens]HWA44504.1 transporter substrate-binding domain-containing protein [Hypericibacter adhaerens]